MSIFFPSSFWANGLDDESLTKLTIDRYMYEKISERSEVLDQLIDDFAELIRSHYDIKELGDPSITTEVR